MRSSCANNNGSAFAGISVNTTWYNTALGICMLIGRFLPMEQLVCDRTARRALGFLGEPAVNVLLLNLDLDRIAPVRR